MSEMMEMSFVIDPPQTKDEWKQHTKSRIMVLAFFTHSNLTTSASSLGCSLELLQTLWMAGGCVLCLVVHAGGGLALIVLLHQLSVSQES